MEDGVGIPEDLRCKRSDGKQWRCSALSMPDKTVCEKHYIQAKRRAANSAMRASEKKARRKMLSTGGAADDAYLDDPGRSDDLDAAGEASASPVGGVGSSGGGGEYSGGPSPVKRHKERRAHKGQGGLYSPELVRGKGGSSARSRHREPAQRDLVQDSRVRSAHATPRVRKAAKGFGGSGPEDCSGRSTDSSGEAEGLTCHQCQRNDRARVVWCMSCAKRGYCESCVLRRYPDMSMEDIRRVCPACRGICNCKVCLRGDSLIKGRIREMASIDKLRHLHRLLYFLLPVLKRIHSEQCYELELEIRVYGIKNDILRAKLNPDEQMCCDSCKIPIFDYHRHCTNCLYDLCLTCCRDLRRASLVGLKGESAECQDVDRSRDIGDAQMLLAPPEKKQSDDSLKNSIDNYTIDFTCSFPMWKANSDNSIPCPPPEPGGCGSSTLVLRRILKINWVAKLVKHAEEMVNGCKASDLESTDECTFCTRSITSQSSHSSNSRFYKCSQREDSNDNFLFCPTLQDIEHESNGHFHKHWIKGEPVVVRHAFEPSLSACWDPMSIWRGIQEIIDDGTKDNVIVKATNCSNQSEVDIELRQFIKGYTDGYINKDGRPEILKLKDWPPTNAVEEFLLCQRPEFLSKLPLLEYFHSKWGLLNLAAKLPHDSMQSDVGPKILISYGTHEKFSGVSMANFQINMGDAVYLLMHTSEAKFQGKWNNKLGSMWKKGDGSDMKDHYVKNEMVNFSVSTSNENCTKNRACGLSLNGKDDDIMEDNACNGIEIAAGGKKGMDFCHTERGFWGLSEKASAGAVWDVFRRQDVPKLNEYLRAHWKELTNTCASQIDKVKTPVYEHGVLLDEVHKRKLKDEFGIEPWTFQQYIGEAVFVPAGCPFQVTSRLVSDLP
uniref:Lysine-specific demethylase 3B n=1 Tax=Anthurium amnicola TaxID=1678845 RepID=A0A1D1ZBL6_9ARAE